MVDLVLRLFDLLCRPLHLAGAEYPKFRAILEVKLRLDTMRKNPAFIMRKGREGKKRNEFALALVMNTFFGIFAGLTIFAAPSPLVSLTIVHSFILTMVAMSLIADFSSVLLDTTDHEILGARPVTRRTVLLARLAHVLVYLSLLTLSLSLVSFAFGTLKYGFLFPPVFALSLAAGVLLVVAIVTVLYLAIMRFFDEEKLRNAILYVQIVMVVGVAGGYQILPRLMHFKLIAEADITGKWWTYGYPPTWLAAPVDMLAGHVGPPQIALTCLAFGAPLAALMGVSALSSRFRTEPESVAKRTHTGAGRQAPAPRSSYFQRLARLVARRGVERAGFDFTWQLCSHSRRFKLRTYPNIAFIFIFGFLFIFMGSSENLAETWAALPSTQKHLLLLYAAVVMIPAVISEMRFTDEPDAAWIYRAFPLARPGELLLGGLKAFFFRFMAPALALVAVVIFALWGHRVLADVVLAVAVAWMVTAANALGHQRAFPFSLPAGTLQSSGRQARNLGLSFFPALLGLGHWALTRVPGGVIVAIPIVLAVAWALVAAYAKTDWTAIEAAAGE